MSYASVTTTFDPFFCHNPDRYGSGSTGYLRKGSICSIQESELSSDLSEELIPVEVDPSRINFFELSSKPSTSTYSNPDQYGVPLAEQQLTIDFTPVPGVDDGEILIKKCNDFWEFIEKNPKLKKFCATPEPTHSSAVDEEEQSVESCDEHQAMLWMANNEKTLGDSFMSKIEKQCEPLPGDYKYGVKSTAQSLRRGKALDRSWLRKCDSIVGRRCLVDNSERVIESFRIPDPSTVEVLKLCQEMEEWDLTHPKQISHSLQKIVYEAELEKFSSLQWDTTAS